MKRSLALLSLLIAIFGLLVIIGWFLDIPIFKSVFPGFQTMKFNTAIGFIFSGLAFYFFIVEGPVWSVRVLVLIPLAIGCLSFFEDITKINLGIDELLFKDSEAAAERYASPGRPSQSTSVCFILISIALFINTFFRSTGVKIAQYLFHCVTLISIIAIVGYILNISIFYKLYFVSSMAIHTSIFFGALSLIGAMLFPKLGLTTLFIGDKSGNVMIRRLFPQMLIITIVISYLRMLASRNNWVSEEYGIALAAVSYIITTMFLLAYNVKRLNIMDIENAAVTEKTILLNVDLQNTVKTLEDYKQALNASLIVEISDIDGKILYANDNFINAGGYSRDEVLGKKENFQNSGHHTREFFRNMWLTVLEGKIWKGEVQNKKKDGRIYWLDTTIIPLTDQQGRPNRFLAIRNDITDRVKYFEALKQSEEVYKDLYENNLVAVITSETRNYRPIMVNNVTVDLFGYSSKEDFLKRFDPLVHLDDPTQLSKAISEVEAKGKVVNLTLKMKNLEGKFFWVKLFAKLHRMKGIIQTVIIDMTDQINVERDLSDKVRELEIANKELETFNFISSHDLQEPLRKIMSFSMVLRSTEKNLTDEGRFFLERLFASSQQMRSIIKDVQSYYGLRNVNRELEKVDIREVIEEVLKLNEKLILERKAKITVLQTCVIQVIRFQIRELFNALILNSLKFSSQDRDLEILIKSEVATGEDFPGVGLNRENNYCHITVEDNGIGFDAKYNERIFELFERLAPEKYAGTGIGLALSKRIVENHKGVIKAKGFPGKGTCIDIYLPA